MASCPKKRGRGDRPPGYSRLYSPPVVPRRPRGDELRFFPADETLTALLSLGAQAPEECTSRNHRVQALGRPQAEVQGWPVGAGTLSGLLRWPRREGKEGKTPTGVGEH